MGNALDQQLEVSVSPLQPVGASGEDWSVLRFRISCCTPAARAVLMRLVVVKKESCRSPRMVAWKGSPFLAVALLAAALPSALPEARSARGFARVFAVRSEDSPTQQRPENDVPLSSQRSLLSSLWIPFKLPWNREARLPSPPKTDPIDTILNGSNDTQFVTVENGGEAFRIVDSDEGEQQQNVTNGGFPSSSSSNYTIPEEESTEEAEEVEVPDMTTTSTTTTTTKEPYRPHKRPVIKSAGSTVVRNCRTSVKELEERMRRMGKFNPIFMASSAEEAGLNFRSLLSTNRFGEGAPQGTGSQSILFSHDAAEEEECDALCREFRDAAARALKESAAGPSPSLTDLPRTSPQMDSPPVLADGIPQSPPFASQCTFRGNVKINSTCTFRGSSSDGDENLVDLCDKCVVIQVMGEGCFPTLFNTISCIGDRTCLFDTEDYHYGGCTESVMQLPVFRNVPTADGCDNWIQESIAVPIGCSCSLLRDRYSPLRAEK